MPVQFPSIPHAYTAEQMGATDLGAAIRSGFDTSIRGTQAAYAPKTMAEELLAAQLGNKVNAVKAKYADQLAQADLSLRNAQINRANRPEQLGGEVGKLIEYRNTLPEGSKDWTYVDQLLNSKLNTGDNDLARNLSGAAKEAYGLQILKSKYGEDSDIYKASKSMYDAKLAALQGGGRGAPAAVKNEQYYLQSVAQDNPALTREQLDQAADAYATGKDSLPDGTKLAPLSPQTQRALDIITKQSSTSFLINKGLQANQAEAELQEAGKYINQIGGNPYGDTIFNVSPSQIIDSLGGGEEGQKKLGRYMGIQALQYELAQIRNRQAGGEPGISATNELMGHSGQIIENHAPRITGLARKEAEKVINDGLNRMLQARNKIGISPSSLTRFQGNAEPYTKTTEVYYNGKWHDVPNKEVSRFFNKPGVQIGR